MLGFSLFRKLANDEEMGRANIPESFSDYWHTRSIGLVRAAALFALVSSILFGFADKHYVPEVAPFMFWYRLLVMVPGCALAVYLAFSRYSERVYIVLAVLCVAVNTGFLVAFLIMDGNSVTFLAITMQTLLFLFVLFRVPFRMALPAGLLVMVTYCVPLFIVIDDSKSLVNYLVLGMIGGTMLAYVAWSKEREERRQHKLLLQIESSHHALVEEKNAKVSALSDLTKYLDHEVSRFVHIAQGALALGKEQRHLDDARESLDGITLVIETARDAASVAEAMQSEEMTHCDLADVVDTVVRNTQGHGFEVETDGVLELQGNHTRLVQMVNAVVSNAVSFSASEDKVRIRVFGDEKGYEISVENRGPALPEPISMLFNTGRSIRENPSEDEHHLGLGLYVAKTIAEAHGGTINARHENGLTCFTVSLPANHSA